tara:strand:- start:1 stop:282 length:282 start_codon:yes stop_codon:yes gene_type:complete
MSKPKFTLIDYMCDILSNFQAINNLESMCAYDSLMVGNFKTEEQRRWLERYCDLWDDVMIRDCDRRFNLDRIKKGRVLWENTLDGTDSYIYGP